MSDGMACRVCGGRCDARWSLRVARDRFVADYYECRECHALQVRDPSWLSEVYADEALPPTTNADSGRFRRNFSAYLYLSALSEAGLFPRAAKVLDFGGGYGLLAQMLVDGGYDAWTSDEYVSRPFLAPHRNLVFSALEPGSFDVVTAFEVFEHLLEPIRLGGRLAGLLSKSGTLIVSTGLYDPRVHDETWPYLAREGGQHVTLWSESAVRHFARVAGFASVGLFPGDGGFMIVFSYQAPPALAGILGRAGRVLRDPGHLHRCVGPWDFRSDGTASDRARVFDAEIAGAAGVAWKERPRRSAARGGLRGAAASILRRLGQR